MIKSFIKYYRVTHIAFNSWSILNIIPARHGNINILLEFVETLKAYDSLYVFRKNLALILFLRGSPVDFLFARLIKCKEILVI